MSSGWIGVDLDGTLAQYGGSKTYTADHIGEPIAPMVERVKEWLEKGIDVRIFTARVSHDGSPKRVKQALESMKAIHEWTLMVFGRELPVTCEKNYSMLELWDDRAVQVEMNTGKILGRTIRNL